MVIGTTVPFTLGQSLQNEVLRLVLGKRCLHCFDVYKIRSNESVILIFGHGLYKHVSESRLPTHRSLSLPAHWPSRIHQTCCHQRIHRSLRLPTLRPSVPYRPTGLTTGGGPCITPLVRSWCFIPIMIMSSNLSALNWALVYLKCVTLSWFVGMYASMSLDLFTNGQRNSSEAKKVIKF